MSKLAFTVVDARIEPYAVVPTLIFRLQITEGAGEQIHAIALRCQIQMEPRRRHYSSGEESQLLELFGEPDRWGDTLRTLLWTHASLMVPGFQDTTVIDVPITCTYDFEVVAAKYLESLEDGEVPLLFLLAGRFSLGGSWASASSKYPGKRRQPSGFRFGYGVSSWTVIFPAAPGSGSDARVSMRCIDSKDATRCPRGTMPSSRC